MKEVLICDDHPLFRRGLKQILIDEFGSAEVGEASTAEEAVEGIRRKEWDLLVLDLSLPGRSGLEVLRDAKRIRPKLPVLILTMYPEVQYGVRALRSGASGYVVKAVEPEELVYAIHKVLTGGRYISAKVAECLADFAGGAEESSVLHERLSDREYEVLRALGRGATVSELAEKLGLSVKTVSTYRSRILQKLDLRTTADIIRYAVANKLVD